MLIIVDRKIPPEAGEKLSAYGTLMHLETAGIVHPAISGHPDIFFCKTPQSLVVSPSLPEKFLHQLEEQKVQFIPGNLASGIRHPFSIHKFSVLLCLALTFSFFSLVNQIFYYNFT